MRRFTTSSAVVVVLLCCELFVSRANAGPAPSDPAATEMLNLGLRGVYFVPNEGQWSDAGVVYGFKTRGLDVAFRESELTMHMTREINEADEATEASPTRERGGVERRLHEEFLADASGSPGEPADFEYLTLIVTFPGSNEVRPEGAKPQAAKFNYFVGGEGRSSASDVPSFAEVVYPDLYDGVDLHVMGNDDGVLKYEFHVAPGADWSPIRIAYDGVDSLCVDSAGDLHINTAFGTLTDGAPVVWQEDGGTAVPAVAGCEAKKASDDGRDARSTDSIPARFELCDDHTYRIALDGPVDPSRELVIDPDVEWMVYLGGRNIDLGGAVKIDPDGNCFLAGATNSTDFTGRNNTYHGGMRDAFVLKLDPSGSLQWMTYLGGSLAEDADGIVLDSAGDILISGTTTSPDFAGHLNAHYGGEDAFAAKLSPTGSLIWMKYFGGSQDDEGALAMVIDSHDNATFTGQTNSTDFVGHANPPPGGITDIYLVQIDPTGAMRWMMYLGGSGDDATLGLGIDSADNILACGNTDSVDFAGRINSALGSEDAIAVKISPTGSVLWMRYIGGTHEDESFGIGADRSDNILITGGTDSVDFQGRNNSSHGERDAYAMKLSPSGAIQWMTYVGGSGWDEGSQLGIDEDGNCIAAATSMSTQVAGALNAYPGGPQSGFAYKVSPSGSLDWVWYLGGTGEDVCLAMTLDAADNAWITGGTSSTNFNGRNNSYYGGMYDAFLVKLRDSQGPQLTVTATCPSGGPIQVSWSGATGGGTIALLYARTTGSFVIPNNHPCAGTALGLSNNQLQIGYQGGAGANGSRTVNSNTGPGACGGYLQLLDLSTCTTSNVARIQ